MAKKRQKVERKRQLQKARLSKKRSTNSKSQPVGKKEETSSGNSDLWFAVGIVVLIVAAFVALYYFGVKNPPKTATEQTPVETVVVDTPITEESEQPPVETVVTDTPVTEKESEMLSWNKPPAMEIDASKSYTAVMTTTQGTMTIELYAGKVPVTVNNFVFLARQGFYDGVKFHRVIDGFMAQTGDPTGTGAGGPGYSFADEFDDTLKHDDVGIVSMANAGTDTNGSQFFICFAPQPHLNGKHAVFGKIVEGLDVLDLLKPRDPSNASAPADLIESIQIIESE